MAIIHLAGLTNDPGVSNEFNAGDTYVIDSYTPSEWNGTAGNLVKFFSGTPGARAFIDVSLIGAVSVSYIDFTDIEFINGPNVVADETCVGRTQNNAGITWPSAPGRRRIYFTDRSTRTCTTWDWDFGDGSSHSNDQNPTHDYPDYETTYQVTLVATNDIGSGTVTKPVTTGAEI